MCIWGEVSVPLEFFLLVSLWHLWGSVPQQDFMGPHRLSGFFWDQGGPPRSICQSVSLAVRLVPLASRLASCPFPPFIAPLRLKKKKGKRKKKHERMRTNRCAGESVRDPPAGSQELTRTRLRAHALQAPAPQLVTSQRLCPALLAAFN